MIRDSLACKCAAYAGLALLLAVPMLTVSVPLGVDTLNHWARIYVRAHIGTDPGLAHLYRVRNDLIPYLGMDVLLTPLARVLPIMIVARLYTVALVWGLVASVALLQRTFVGRIGWAPLVAGLVAYNGLLAWGFLNYLLGLELALAAFAAWHVGRRWPWRLRLVVFTLASTLLYLTHILAFAVYGILVGSYEVFGRRKPWHTPWPDWVVLAGQAIPALLLWRQLDLPPPVIGYDLAYSPAVKLLALESPFLFGSAAGSWDLGNVVALVAIVGVFLAARRGLLVCPRLIAAPTLVLVALSIVTPTWLMHVFFIDARFPLAVACLLIAGLQWRVPNPVLNTFLAAAVAVVTIGRVFDITQLMQGCDRRYAELSRGFALLPRGAELALVAERLEPNRAEICTSLPFDHAAELIIMERSGYSPGLFSKVTSVAVRDNRTSDALPIDAQEFTAAPPSGYVFWMHFGDRRPEPAGLTAIERGSFFDLYKVD